jgi:hypothetical protein
MPIFALVLGIAASLVGPDLASAQSGEPTSRVRSVIQFAQADDFDCADFETQDEAQAVLNEDPADPNNLDPNQDGIACALLPSGEDQSSDPGDAAVQAADAGNQTREERRAARRAARQQNGEGTPTTEETTEVTCVDFETPEEAQAAFDADPEGLAELDRDGNGIACEELLEPEPTAQPNENTPTRQDRRRNRRNQEEEPAPTEVVVDEPKPVRIKEDFDCVDFEFQEEAQEVYDQDRSDPYNLDPNGDGEACSSLPSSNPRISQVPRTGSGPSTGFTAELFVAASVLLGLVGAFWRLRPR